MLWFVIGARGNWAIKMLAIFVTLMFSLNIARSLDNLAGWPSSEELPAKFIIHWVLVKEPNKILKTDGGIYLWVNDLNSNREESWEFFQYDHELDPRVYYVSYSLEMHEISMKIREKLKAGEPVVGMSETEMGELNSPGQLLKSLVDEDKRKELGSVHSPDAEGLFFYQLPPGELPPK